ncbi:hypothetical protein DK26_11490 [Bosea sp. WAO]|uniref:hypothetical protein n=1 Tax=Bosea sp. WAO TaxID=406341 RepID=UPI000747F1F0|nr:hypothetical protein [Bosea sp. WAO]KUL95697.1 hypothetical protein DK26_11490 [Bosea sp. WAO]
MNDRKTLDQRGGGHGHRHHHASRGRSHAAHPISRQERMFFALLGGCLGLTLIASAMLQLVAG